MSSPHDEFLQMIDEEVNAWTVREFLDYAEEHKETLKLEEEWNKATSLHSLIVHHLAEEKGGM